jgi:nucleoside-diphosphate-sugar epimerase
MTDARVLVTGGSGFVGRQVVAALRTLGADVAAPGAPRPDLLQPTARRELLDATRPEILLHAAWITRPGYWGDPENLEWIIATLDLLRQFAGAGGRRFVLVGSCAEYDWARASRTPWRESRPCRPHSLYGAAKLAAATALLAYARHAGLTAAVARVFSPVGRHEAAPRLLPSLVRAVLAGSQLDVGPAELTRDLMDVRDTGEAIARLALSRAVGPVNIGTGRPVSLGELARRVGGNARVRLGARALREGEPLWMVADPSLLRRATGFVPRFTLRETIADAFDYWCRAAPTHTSS